MKKEYTGEASLKEQYGKNLLLSKKYLIEEQNKEIERLNNIINELEKYFEERVSKSVLKGCSYEQTYITGKWDAYNNSLNKIQELKGDSSNE